MEHADAFTVLYDGQCPLCAREIAFLRRRNHRGRLTLVDISQPGFDPAPTGLTRNQLMQAFTGLRGDGELLRGMPAFRAAYRAVGLGWLMAPTAWLLLRPLFDAGYRLFARHRVRIGGWFGRHCEQGSCRPR